MKHSPIATFFSLLTALPALYFCRCDPYLFTSPTVSRTITVRVAVDPDFADHRLWRENVDNLFDNASLFYKSWFDIEFTIDTMLIWDLERSPSYRTMLDHDCLVKDVPKGGSDIVVYLTKEADRSKAHYAGLSLFTEGYIRVIQADWVDRKGDFIKAFHTLLHELGHLFGAMHLYDDRRKETVYMMDPFITDDLIEKRGMSYGYVEPEIHPGNAEVIATVSRYYPFTRSPSPDSLRPVLAAYRRLRAEHCAWSLTKDRRIVNHEFDEYHEEAWYYFVANWASLFGDDSLALVSCDSLDETIGAIRRTCQGESGACKSRFCLRAGCAGALLEQWYSARRVSSLWIRAMAHLRAGRDAPADSLVWELCRLIPEELAARRDEYRGSFRFYQSRFLDGDAGRHGSLP